MANQKQPEGEGGLAGAKLDPGILKEESTRRAPQAAPSRRLSGCQTAAGARAQGVESLPQFTLQAKKERIVKASPDALRPENPAPPRSRRTSSWFCIASGLYWNCFLSLVLTATTASGSLNLISQVGIAHGTAVDVT